jgi:hypothetical protein
MSRRMSWAVLLLAVTLVVLLALLYDESRYRSCLEAGGRAAGQEVTIEQLVDDLRDGEPPECSRLAPF